MHKQAFILNKKQQISGLKRGVFRVDDDQEWERRCSRCDEWLPFAPEFWYAYVSQGREITQSHCIACEKERCASKRPPKVVPPKKSVTLVIDGFRYCSLS